MSPGCPLNNTKRRQPRICGGFVLIPDLLNRLPLVRNTILRTAEVWRYY